VRTIYSTFWAIVLGASSFALKAQVAPATVTSATASSSGEAVQILYSDGKELAAPKLKDQVSFGRPLVAKDKRTVGWLAMLPNCCTSYPIPLTLVIYRDGRIIASISPGMSIFHWLFLSQGDRVALSTDVLHGGSDYSAEYELYEVSSGRHLAHWNEWKAKEQPEWVGLLLSDDTNDLSP
jgi:hypothetical protein